MPTDRPISPFSLAGHTALVTGSTQGVGASIAVAIAEAGGNVCIHGLAIDDQANKVIARCREFGVQVRSVPRDLCDSRPESMIEFVHDAFEAIGPIDLLVNNAGTYCDLPFLEMTPQRYQKTMRLNVDAGFFITQAFAGRWVESSTAGRVVFTGSINGVLAEPDHVAYDASKGAVAAMVRSLCVSLAPHGIRVNSIAPGLVRTPLTNATLSHDADVLAWMRLHTPNAVVPDSDVCGPAAVFLLSDAAKHIHGQTIFVDGGMSAWQQPDLPQALRGHL
jgi:NAD(P)-dependent dehydrogenase (short-subunit alcohol dehydrogenase family)